MRHRTQKLLDGYVAMYQANSEEYRRDLIAWLDLFRPGMSEKVIQLAQCPKCERPL